MLVTLEILKFLILEMKADFQAFQMAYISFFDFKYSQSCILFSNVRKKRVFLQAMYTQTRKYRTDRDFLRKISTDFGHFLKKYLRYRKVIYLFGKP